MPLHFVTTDAATAAAGDVLTLTGAEAHHAAVVRRVRAGEQVTLGDGRGVWLDGRCTAVDSKRVEVEVTARTDVPAPRPRLVLAQALAKGDRDELAVQAATELGVDEVIPWQAARSVSRWSAEKAVKGRARWEAIVREAAKQAHRAWVPEVAEITSTPRIAARAAASHVIVLEPTGEVRLSAVAIDPAQGEVVLVVGPEGGIAADELALLADAGATIAALGDTVLRTSTAGPAALAVVSTILGRW
nr:16S rRNA (uracil(1498)-N(3))-methyltransferase [Microbacterium bovistercoris]